MSSTPEIQRSIHDRSNADLTHDASAFSLTLSELYFPKGVSFERIDALTLAAKDLNITYTASNVPQVLPLTSWCSALTLPCIPREFFINLATLSAHPVSDTTLSSLKLSSFCELRAALAALTVQEVTDVTVSLPNSASDRRGADVTLHLHNGREQELQIKSREGKKGRQRAGIPTLTNVAISNFQELAARIRSYLPSSAIFSRIRSNLGKQVSTQV